MVSMVAGFLFLIGRHLFTVYLQLSGASNTGEVVGVAARPKTCID